MVDLFMRERSALTPRPTHFPLQIPMRITVPDASELAAFEAMHEEAGFNHPHVGASVVGLPEGWPSARVAQEVGHGAAVFERACAAVDHWQAFDQEWLRLSPPRVPPEPGDPITFASRQLGFWMLHPCRIVEVIDDRGADRWFHAIAYGMLDGHVLAGEERIGVAWDRGTDAVAVEILSFFRPGHPISAVTGPVTRASQARFRARAIPLLAAAARG